MTDYHLSRPLLEHAVRRAVRKIPNIEFLEEHDFVGLTADTDRARITGARVQKRGGTDETVIAADLVVDATGRGPAHRYSWKNSDTAGPGKTRSRYESHTPLCPCVFRAERCTNSW